MDIKKVSSDAKDSVISPIPEAIGNTVKTSDSTKAIVQEIRNRRTNDLQNIVDKINQFKIGTGFAYV